MRVNINPMRVNINIPQLIQCLAAEKEMNLILLHLSAHRTQTQLNMCAISVFERERERLIEN